MVKTKKTNDECTEDSIIFLQQAVENYVLDYFKTDPEFIQIIEKNGLKVFLDKFSSGSEDLNLRIVFPQKRGRRSEVENRLLLEAHPLALNKLKTLLTTPCIQTDDKTPELVKTDGLKADGLKTEGVKVEGILDIIDDNFGILRSENCLPSNNDIYVNNQMLKKFSLRQGDHISGFAKSGKDNDKMPALIYITEVNGRSLAKIRSRRKFEYLTPVYPEEKFTLENTDNDYANRIIDLIAPIGKGQRGLIVSQPKTGKTTLLKKIASAISKNNPETKLIILLIDERPEEVSDIKKSVKAEVLHSTFDNSPENHVKLAEMVLERAKRLVELGDDVIILLDSITRLARAYNLSITPSGRTLSGGLDPASLHGPKKFFGAARNIENGGSLTIIATALIDTGSRMDDLIFEEFKGTGNMELFLDRRLAEKRIYPAIDIVRSGTRKEELLLTSAQLESAWRLRKSINSLDLCRAMSTVLNLMKNTDNNQLLVEKINQVKFEENLPARTEDKDIY